MKKHLFFLFLFGLSLNSSFAQFQTGLSSGNYAGVMGTTLNPANTNFLNNGTDFLLLHYSTTVMNNGLYIESKPITRLLSKEVFTAFTQKEGSTGETVSETFDRVFDVKRDLQDKNYIFADVSAYGPSFLINYQKHSFGLITSFKSSSSSIDLPPELVTFLLKGVGAADNLGKTFNFNKLVSGTMVYTDIGLNYSYEIVDNFHSQQRLGLTGHFLNGINSMVFEDRGGTTWSFIGDSTIYMQNGNFDYNYAATKSADIQELLSSRGKGFAFDIGYTYLKKKKSRPTRLTVCPNIRFGGKIREYQDYKYRFGISLMDVGYIKFNRQSNANKYVNAEGNVRNLDLAFYGGLFSLDRALRYAYGNPGVVLFEQDQYTHYTPTRLQVQFDYNYKNNIYFNFAASQRINLEGKHSMHAANIVSLSARYEKPRYEIGIPVSLVEYEHPIIGLNFRVGPFYMGTNHLLEAIGLKTIKGIDIYFGLKFNLSNFRGV